MVRVAFYDSTSSYWKRNGPSILANRRSSSSIHRFLVVVLAYLYAAIRPQKAPRAQKEMDGLLMARSVTVTAQRFNTRGRVIENVAMVSIVVGNRVYLHTETPQGTQKHYSMTLDDWKRLTNLEGNNDAS